MRLVVARAKSQWWASMSRPMAKNITKNASNAADVVEICQEAF